MTPNPALADRLTDRAEHLAATAAKRFIAADAERQSRYGKDAEDMWRGHIYERIMELSSAILLGQPSIFSTRVKWSKTAMLARGGHVDDVDVALNVLSSTIRDDMDDDGMTIIAAYLDADQKISEGVDTSLLASKLDPALALDRLTLQDLQSAMSGNSLQAMETVLDALEDGTTVPQIITKVLLPAQYEIGRLWHINEASVAEEHIVSNTTRRLMAVLADRMHKKTDCGKTVVSAAILGNAHDMGIRAITYFFEFEGWRTIYLGADTPRQEIVSSIAVYDADLVLLSAGLTTQLPTLQKTIDEIRAIHNTLPILVGGNAFLQNDELWKDIGADGSASDIPHTIVLADQLIT